MGMGEAVPPTGMGMGEALLTMGMGRRMGKAVPTEAMGTKQGGGMLDRPFREQVVVQLIVGGAGWEWEPPRLRRDSRPVPIPVPSILGIPVPLSPVVTLGKITAPCNIRRRRVFRSLNSIYECTWSIKWSSCIYSSRIHRTFWPPAAHNRRRGPR